MLNPTGVRWTLVVIVAMGLIAAGCGGTDGDGAGVSEEPVATDSPSDTPTTDSPSDTPTTDSPPSEALAQMEAVFEGNPSRDNIQADLDKALRLYELRATEENYSRAGSALVGLRKEFGVPEMQMLRYAIRLQLDTRPGVNLDLPSAFGLAAVDLKTR